MGARRRLQWAAGSTIDIRRVNVGSQGCTQAAQSMGHTPLRQAWPEEGTDPRIIEQLTARCASDLLVEVSEDAHGEAGGVWMGPSRQGAARNVQTLTGLLCVRKRQAYKERSSRDERVGGEKKGIRIGEFRKHIRGRARTRGGKEEEDVRASKC